ncbi:MAG TPA: TetR/AcrR family transcriptional regulator [Anaerolineales bacterium]|nr:TetR/AcrR family transcriptional regulator [Anaerolineales bacterium]
MTRRERLRNATLDEIKTTAWQQIAEHGAAGLSLREIARRMGVSTPALYRYYPDRDALVTALIIDAFASFAEWLESERDKILPDDHAGRFRALGMAYRQWAITYPQRYNLIFVTPIPGYRIPPEAETVGQRAFMVVVDILASAYAAGKLRISAEFIKLPKAMLGYLKSMFKERSIPYPPEVFCLAIVAWNQIHGAISLELHGILDSMLNGHKEAFFEHQIHETMRQLRFE